MIFVLLDVLGEPHRNLDQPSAGLLDLRLDLLGQLVAGLAEIAEQEVEQPPRLTREPGRLLGRRKGSQRSVDLRPEEQADLPRLEPFLGLPGAFPDRGVRMDLAHERRLPGRVGDDRGHLVEGQQRVGQCRLRRRGHGPSDSRVGTGDSVLRDLGDLLGSQ